MESEEHPTELSYNGGGVVSFVLLLLLLSSRSDRDPNRRLFDDLGVADREVTIPIGCKLKCRYGRLVASNMVEVPSG